MTISGLDRTLMRRAARAPRKDEISEDDRIAMNLLWRDGVRVPVLCDIFKCSRSTIYYNCLTGYGDPTVRAAEINAKIDRMSSAEARKYVRPWMVQMVNLANANIAEANEAVRRQV